MKLMKIVPQVMLIIALGLMYAWAYGGATALNDSAPVDPEMTKDIEAVLERQTIDDWNGDADDAPKVALAKSAEEEAELEETY